MSIFGPDISSFETGFDINGIGADYPFVIAKVTEGSTYVDPPYTNWLAAAKAAGKIFVPYHFLTTDSTPAEQAANLAANIGDPTLPVMVDVEPEADSVPTVADLVAFADACAALKLRVKLIYLPSWYWRDRLGSPDLTPLKARGIAVISSHYPRPVTGGTLATYAADGGDTGPGWNTYGGVVPLLWQFADDDPIDDQTVDVNAYRGTAAELAAFLGEAYTTPPTPPTPATDSYQYRATHNTHTPLKVDGGCGPLTTKALQYVVGTAVDGDWGPDSIRDLQKMLGVAVDGQQGPITVKALQRKVGASPDGSWGAVTTSCVQRCLNAGSLS
jgi:hypothetical protein